ncbi:MAG: transcriptional repressor LexA [Deltaproteobacteria bacterium]|nr:transcriptional repressor LexA [Deltaproteobacteria bacterium]
MRELTRRQSELLEFIEDHLHAHGYPPSIREMAEHMGIRSTNGVNDHLKALERKGYVEREHGLKSRAIALRGRPQESRAAPSVSIPVLGRVAAGLPVLSEENLEGHIQIGRSLLPSGGPLFALRVRGESMRDKGILDGDTVIVKKQSRAEAGQIVVALIDGEATVKTYRPSKRSISFEPANPDFQPIVLRRSDFRAADILGVVAGVFRRLDGQV